MNVIWTRNCSAHSEPMTSHALGRLAGSRKTLLDDTIACSSERRGYLQNGHKFLIRRHTFKYTQNWPKCVQNENLSCKRCSVDYLFDLVQCANYSHIDKNLTHVGQRLNNGLHTLEKELHSEQTACLDYRLCTSINRWRFLLPSNFANLN